MATTTNSMLKGTIVFAMLTIAGAAMFVGTGSSESPASTAQSQPEAEIELPQQSQVITEPVEEFEEVYDEDYDDSDWGEESLVDDTSGFDPSPDAGSKLSERALNEESEIQFKPNTQPAAGALVGIPSTAGLPES